MKTNIRNSIIKYNNLKLKCKTNRCEFENIVRLRILLDNIITYMIKNNIKYENLYNNSSTKLLKNLKLEKLNDYIKDKRKYKIRKYIINRGNRDINNDIKHISDKLSLGLLRL